MVSIFHAIAAGAAALGGALVQVVLFLLGGLAGGIIKFIAGNILVPLLNHTLFQPITLSPTAHFTQTAGINGISQQVEFKVWVTMAALSGGVALAGLAWGVFQRLALRSVTGGEAQWRDIGQGLGMWALVLIGGQGFLALLLSTANTVTGSLAHYTTTLVRTMTTTHSAVGASGTLVFAVSLLFWQVAGLLLVGLIVWVVATWLMRIVDLIFFVGLLPLTAAIGVSGSKDAFRWNFQEAIGAIFAQLAMVIAWWVASLILLLPLGTGTINPWQETMQVVLGVAAMTLVGRAPKMLQQITGHQQAGVGGIMMAAAGGMLVSRAVGASFGATKGGTAIAKHLGNLGAQSAEAVSSWSQLPTMGERFAGTKMGAWSRERISAAGAAVTNSKAGQAVGTLGRKAGSAPVIGAALTAAAGTAGAGVRSVRNLGSMAIQPRATMGRGVERGMAAGARSQEVSMGQQVGALVGAGLSYEQVGRQLHLSPEQVGQFMGDGAATATPHSRVNPPSVGQNAFRRTQDNMGSSRASFSPGTVPSRGKPPSGSPPSPPSVGSPPSGGPQRPAWQNPPANKVPPHQRTYI